MSGKCIVVTSGKGGVGKTTSTTNIGSALAMYGPKVVLIDTDIGLRNLDLLIGLENRILYDLTHVIEGKCPVRKALIKHKKLENLSFLPASMSRDKEEIQPEQVKAIVEDLKSDFDYIIVDCAAGIDQGFKIAVAGADEAVVITTPEMSAVRDADRVVAKLEGSGISKSRLVVNRVRPDMVKRKDMMEVDDVLEFLGIELLGVVPDDESIIISTNRGEPAVLDDKSKAGKAFRDIALRLMGTEVPMDNFDEPEGFWTRFKKMIGLDKS